MDHHFERTAPHRLPELMDRADCDPALLEGALDAIAGANRWLGGDRLLWRQLRRILPRRGPRPGKATLRLLDVGAGSGRTAARMARRLERRGWRPRLVLADLHPGALAIVRNRLRGSRPSRGMWLPDLVRLTGTRLPFADDGVDVAISATTLHHLERSEVRRFLGELDRVSRLGWVVTDLRRSRPAYLAMRGLAATLWRRRPLPRRDGPVSIRRAFTPRELRSLVREAGLPEARVTGRLFRLAVRG